MKQGRTTIGATSAPHFWTALGMLALTLAVSACTAPSTPGPTSTPPPLDVSTPVPTRMATPPPVPTLPFLPTAIPQPTATPFPDEQEIVDAVLALRGADHWVAHRVGGSFTAPDVDEWLALVGNIGDCDEVRWVVIGQADGGWRLRGTSEVLATGFGDAPPHYFPPDLLDFDGDGQQELLVNYFRMQWGWMTASDTLYHWNGHALASVWGAPTSVDNRMADGADVPQPYRENYQAEWEWADLDGDGLDEILFQEHVAFYLPGEEGYVNDDAPSIGEESEEQAFRWDGEAFHPFAPAGPAGTFAYVEAGNLWLWQNRAAHPLSIEHVQEFHWSPDGRRVAWWARPPLGEDSQTAILGIYDLTTGIRQEFPLDDTPSALRWAPDGRVAYALLDQPLVFLDPGTGEQRALPATLAGSWSPDGSRLVYGQNGSLHVYDLSTGQGRFLVEVAEEGGQAFDPVWSPRGDWVACTLETDGFAYVGLISPDPLNPLSGLDLLEPFDGREAPALRFAWSPDGSHLATLTTDPHAEQQLAVLYIAEVPPSGDDPIGRPEWQETLQLKTVTQTVGLAWSPDGGRVAIAAGNEVWEMTVLRQDQGAAGGEATLRHRFSVPDPRWLALGWAPDGSGFLAGLAGAGVGYEEHLYWFPADGSEPVLLLAGFDAAHFPPRIAEAQVSLEDRPPMVLAEHTDAEPLIHFVEENGYEVAVLAEGADRFTEFQVAGQRVYYEGHYADKSGVVSLPIPDVPGDLYTMRVASDGSLLAWLFVDDQIDPANQTGEARFRLVVTDDQGNDPREVWHRIETPPDLRWIKLLGWRADGREVYLSQNKYMDAAAYFELTPGILAVDVATGWATQVGDLEGVADGAVSPDGNWLVQAKTDLEPAAGLTIILRSLTTWAEVHIPSAEGALLAGDFSFAPDNGWLAWREWGSMPKGSKLQVRALRLPDGEPFTVYEEALDYAPTVIGGWVAKDSLVLVQGDGTGPSTVVKLLPTGPGSLLSPLAFLGVLD